MLEPHVEAFAKRMAAAFGTPDTSEPGEYKQLLNERLARFREGVLMETAEHFIETRRTWPKLADILATARNKAASDRPDKPRVHLWARAEELAEKWFAARADGDVIDRAEAEGWSAKLWHDVKCMAHGELRKGTMDPYLSDLTPSADWIEYNSQRAEAYRLAKAFQQTDGYREKYLKHKARLNPGEAIMAQLKAEGVE